MAKAKPGDDHPTAPRSEGVEEAAAEYVEKAEAYRRYIQEGLDDVAAGRVHDWEDVKAELRAKYGVLKD